MAETGTPGSSQSQFSFESHTCSLSLCCHGDRFKQTCEEAFKKLRNHGSLFINLFSLMLSCEIPELTTPNDINYIRDALCLGMTEEMALDNFRKRMKEAISNAWSVSVNWYFHNVKRAGN